MGLVRVSGKFEFSEFELPEVLRYLQKVDPGWSQVS